MSESQTAEPVILCEHRCLKDDGHVDRGEPHFYGYAINYDPRAWAAVEGMDKAMGALRYELPAEVWADVDKRYRLVRTLALSSGSPDRRETDGSTHVDAAVPDPGTAADHLELG